MKKTTTKKEKKIPCLQAQVFALQLLDLILQLETSKSIQTNKKNTNYPLPLLPRLQKVRTYHCLLTFPYHQGVAFSRQRR